MRQKKTPLLSDSRGVFLSGCAIHDQHDDSQHHRQDVQRRLAGGIGEVARDKADDQTDQADEEQKDSEYHLSGHMIPSLPEQYNRKLIVLSNDESGTWRVESGDKERFARLESPLSPLRGQLPQRGSRVHWRTLLPPPQGEVAERSEVGGGLHPCLDLAINVRTD